MNAHANRVVLLHDGPVMHYRVSIYNYLYERFNRDGIQFSILAPGIESGAHTVAMFPLYEMVLSYWNVIRVVRKVKPAIVILFSGFRNPAVFPVVWSLRVLGIGVICWGHGINLQRKQTRRRVYALLHSSCSALLLYAENLKQYVHERHHHKTFIANNTLCLPSIPQLSRVEKRNILEAHGLRTCKNIVFVGRMKRRKRVCDLVDAMRMIDDADIGAVLVGPDMDRVLPAPLPARVVHIPALYGRDVLELMVACDICCCPGWVGLNIVDALACGLPFVTEDIGDHAPEIMYLKHGENGVLIPAGRIDVLAETLRSLLNDDERRFQMSQCAKATYETEACVEQMYNGFLEALRYVLSSMDSFPANAIEEVRGFSPQEAGDVEEGF